jgi:uncharacterized protein (TIGR03437 family)
LPAAVKIRSRRAVRIKDSSGIERLILSGCGIRFHSSLSTLIATIGGTYAQVISAEAHPDSVGIDRVELLVPRSLAGRGDVDVLLTVNAQISNPVRVNIK